MTYIIKNSIYRIGVLSVLMCPLVQMNGHMDSTGHIKMNLKGKNMDLTQDTETMRLRRKRRRFPGDCEWAAPSDEYFYGKIEDINKLEEIVSAHWTGDYWNPGSLIIQDKTGNTVEIRFVYDISFIDADITLLRAIACKLMRQAGNQNGMGTEQAFDYRELLHLIFDNLPMVDGNKTEENRTEKGVGA